MYSLFRARTYAVHSFFHIGIVYILVRQETQFLSDTPSQISCYCAAGSKILLLDPDLLSFPTYLSWFHVVKRLINFQLGSIDKVEFGFCSNYKSLKFDFVVVNLYKPPQKSSKIVRCISEESYYLHSKNLILTRNIHL